jgi:hypothetical protein
MRALATVRLVFATLFVLSVLWSSAISSAVADEVAIAPLIATARRAGLRLLESDHLVLATDRPARQGDGVEDLPRIFDQAFASWCVHFAIPPATRSGWRAFGCLMAQRDRFIAIGLLPKEFPAFKNGYCDRNRFWLVDQPSPDYRRHLLLHEGVHAFTSTVRSLNTPPWYTEGIAELLATHRLVDGRFEPTPIPLRAGDVQQLGRIEKIGELRAKGGVPSLEDVFQTPANEHHDLAAYAASWAATAMLAIHPAYAAMFAAVEAGPLDQEFKVRLQRSRGWSDSRAGRDFDAFADELDYGYDFSRSAIDWSPGQPLASTQQIVVDASKGWQNSGWSVAQGESYSLTASGRCTIGVLPPSSVAGLDATGALGIESEAAGISLRWYRGRPLGRLLVAQWGQVPGGEASRRGFVVVATGEDRRWTASADGVVYFKVNDAPGELAENSGTLSVAIAPVPRATARD